MGYPTIYPTGTTIYKPEKCWNGFTLFQANEHGAMLIDMNGREVRYWKGLHGFPNKLLPNGDVLGATGERPAAFAFQDKLDLVQVDWDGKIVWKFDHLEEVQDGDGPKYWCARQHHDFQREGNPVGYYVPGMEAQVDGGTTLVLCHSNRKDDNISSAELLSDRIVEVDWEGNIIWDWDIADHFEEIGFDADARETIHDRPDVHRMIHKADWVHINCASYLGPNHWYDEGDERFNPKNIIFDSRNANFMAIIDHETGELVWKVGPDYTGSDALRKMGIIIGMHHTHMIPKGLPGEGNIMVFDNGGSAGYTAPNITSENGVRAAKRDYSRVLEFDPTTLEIVWQCTPADLGKAMPFLADQFYSPYISGAQRLPNGNTLICEGSDGHFFEVTPDHEVVWEYISPYWGKMGIPTNQTYRAYRYPYEYAPQAAKPVEVPVAPVDVQQFRMPGAASKGTAVPVEVEGVVGYGVFTSFHAESD